MDESQVPMHWELCRRVRVCVWIRVSHSNLCDMQLLSPPDWRIGGVSPDWHTHQWPRFLLRTVMVRMVSRRNGSSLVHTLGHKKLEGWLGSRSSSNFGAANSLLANGKQHSSSEVSSGYVGKTPSDSQCQCALWSQPLARRASREFQRRFQHHLLIFFTTAAFVFPQGFLWVWLTGCLAEHTASSTFYC